MLPTSIQATRTLVFVEDRADAGPPAPGTETIVLDASWTPAPDERVDVLPIRPALATVLDRVDLYQGSLDVLDRWAAGRDATGRYQVGTQTWWFRARLTSRWAVHELLLWREVLDLVAPLGRYDRLVIPSERTALLAAARVSASVDGTDDAASAGDGSVAAGPRVMVVAFESAPPADPPPPKVPLWTRLRTGVRRLARRIVRRVRATLGIHPPVPPVPPRTIELARRATLLDERAARFTAQPGCILAVATAGFFQRTDEGGRTRSVDPYLAPVIDRLLEDGRSVVTIGLQLDHRRDTDWVQISADPTMLPESLFKPRWGAEEDEALVVPDVNGMLADQASPLHIGDHDLGPAVATILETEWDSAWLASQARTTARAERLMRDLRPDVLFLDHEGGRTAYLAAARRLGIPIVVVQHGIIYPGNPEYCHDLHPGLVRPDLTCVFGTYERDVLTGHGAFDPATVVVTGSPRSSPVPDLVLDRAAEREEVRRELGVADGHRMVVISVAHNPVAGDLHSVNMVARMLGGPLPNVHVVFKLHPQEKTEGRYRATLEGLARAGGYASPAISVVRDFDLFRLLRAADAHLGQYSTVLTDAVVAGTPSMIAVGLAYSDMLGYVQADVAVPVASVDDVRRFMADPRPPDPAARARFLEAHFRSGDATRRIIDAMDVVMDGSAPPR